MNTNGHVKIQVWNWLWFDSLSKVLYTVIILAKIYIGISNVDLVWQWEKKEEIWPAQSFDKSPYTHRKIQTRRDNT